MAVYVDKTFIAHSKNKQAAKHGSKWCHMWADTLEELHEMALRIGLKRSYFQNHRMLPHYDLVPVKRDKAIALGAIEANVIDFMAIKSKQPITKN